MASNTRRRWTPSLLAASAAAIGLWVGTREPAPPPAAALAVGASPLALPLRMPHGPAAAASVPLPVMAPNIAAPPQLPAAPRIGSEGYGPHIERAQAGSDAPAAWEAVQWLRSCISNEGRRTSLEALRNQGVSPEMMTQMMVEADAEGRRCQTVTARHHALLPELAARAMRAGVPEAASAYAHATFPADLSPAQRGEVTDAMRRDAQTGQSPSLLGALIAHEAWGLSEAEKLAYLAAYISVPDQPGNKTMAKALMDQGAIRFKAPPTADRLEAVKPAVQQILERVRAAKS